VLVQADEAVVHQAGQAGRRRDQFDIDILLLGRGLDLGQLARVDSVGDENADLAASP
jgi:hypothetical protein